MVLTGYAYCMNHNERTSGGVIGKVVGKAKEVLGVATDRDRLVREGRLQEAKSEAELGARHSAERARERERRAALDEREVQREADRAHLENRVLANQCAADIEAVRRQENADAALQADRQRAVADSEERDQHADAERSVQEAERANVAAAEGANQLERAAAAAEDRARRIEEGR